MTRFWTWIEGRIEAMVVEAMEATHVGELDDDPDLTDPRFDWSADESY